MSKIKMSALTFARAAGLGILVCSAAMIAAQAPSGTAGAASTATSPEDYDAAAAELAGSIGAELSSLPDTATAEDIEAFIVFRLDQGTYAPEVVERTLTLLGDSGTSPALKSALSNVRVALLKRKLNRGTAALLNSGGGFGFTGFSSSVVGIGGGGGSDYDS